MFSSARLSLKLTAIVLAGTLTGCETFGLGDSVWYKPGGTVEERDRLLAAAEVQAVQAQSAFPAGSPNVTVDRKQTERHTVLTFMTAAGWSLVSKKEAGSLDNATKVKSPPRTMTAPTALDR